MILGAPIRLQDDAVKRSGSARGASAGRDGVDLQANLHLEKKKSEGNEIAFAQENSSNFSSRGKSSLRNGAVRKMHALAPRGTRLGRPSHC